MTKILILIGVDISFENTFFRKYWMTCSIRCLLGPVLGQAKLLVSLSSLNTEYVDSKLNLPRNPWKRVSVRVREQPPPTTGGSGFIPTNGRFSQLQRTQQEQNICVQKFIPLSTRTDLHYFRCEKRKISEFLLLWKKQGSYWKIIFS